MGAVISAPNTMLLLWDFATSGSFCAASGLSNSSLCQLFPAFSTLQCCEVSLRGPESSARSSDVKVVSSGGLAVDQRQQRGTTLLRLFLWLLCLLGV